jgi:hypothetical protein
MALFKIWRKFPFPTALLKEYFMCHQVWKIAMPYKVVEITPEQKYRWNWRIQDSINFVLFKWNFEHNFTSIQEEHEDHLSIRFENSNQVNDFFAQILFREEIDRNIENTVIFQFERLNLKDPLLNTMKIAFIEVVKKDYKIFLDNVYNLLQEKQKRRQILKDCYWTNYEVIQFPGDD